MYLHLLYILINNCIIHVMHELNIYFHIPYCKAKCRFCSFYVVPGRKTHLDRYFAALEKEIINNSCLFKNRKIKSIYIGGGTPSLVETNYIIDAINCIRKNYSLLDDCEISIEMNPETITEEKVADFEAVGINRISIGLQATQNNILKFLGRLYTFEEFQDYYSIVQNSKIKNINIDLIFGIPTLSLGDWKESIYKTIALNPAHISTYSLEVDEDSIFGYLEKRGRFKRIEESVDRQMYRAAKQILNKYSYAQYEISNFSKVGFECVHNKEIWKGSDYIGFGASSHSRFNNIRFNNVNSIEKYIEQIECSGDARENIVNLENKDLLNERIILNLRTTNGINIKQLNTDFKIDFVNVFKDSLNKLRTEKLIQFDNNNISLTSKGQDLENLVSMELISI